MAPEPGSVVSFLSRGTSQFQSCFGSGSLLLHYLRDRSSWPGDARQACRPGLPLPRRREARAAIQTDTTV